jgi:hypothetical protein
MDPAVAIDLLETVAPLVDWSWLVAIHFILNKGNSYTSSQRMSMRKAEL